MFGVGKAKVLAVAKEIHLQHPGHKDANLNDVLLGSTAMLAKCYGQKEVSSSKDRNKFMLSLLYLYIYYLNHKRRQFTQLYHKKCDHAHLSCKQQATMSISAGM